MSPPPGPEDDAALQFLAAIRSAMDSAQAAVSKGQEKRSAELSVALAEQAAGASARAAQIIAGIPALIQTATQWTLENQRPTRSGIEFDCQAQIMKLHRLESEERPGYPARPGAPDPAKLRFAARLVFDFCSRSELGLHPQVAVATGYDRCSTAYAYLAIVIRWNLPTSIKQT